MTDFKFHIRLGFGALALLAFSGLAPAGEAPGVASAAAKPVAAAADPAIAPDVASYCQSLVPAMADAHAAAEMAQLKALRAEIAKRMAELAAKKAEVEDWVKKREAFMRQADEGKIAIYVHMRPDAAAAQLTDMDDAVAAAIIAKLPARNASVILSEMAPERAAKLTASIGAADAADKKL